MYINIYCRQCDTNALLYGANHKGCNNQNQYRFEGNIKFLLSTKTFLRSIKYNPIRTL